MKKCYYVLIIVPTRICAKHLLREMEGMRIGVCRPQEMALDAPNVKYLVTIPDRSERLRGYMLDEVIVMENYLNESFTLEDDFLYGTIMPSLWCSNGKVVYL